MNSLLRVIAIALPLLLFGLASCNLKSHTAKESSLGDSRNVKDTAGNTQDFDAAAVLEWHVKAQNTGYAFKQFKVLKDNSFIASLTHIAHINHAISGNSFSDSKGQPVLEFSSTTDLLLKITKEGEKEWLKTYIPEHDFIGLVSHTVTTSDKVVALVSLSSDYFSKLEEERLHEESMDEEYEPPTDLNDTAEADPVEDKFRDSFGLQFFSKQGQSEAIVPIPELSAEVKILAFETLGNDKFVLAGIYWEAVLKDKPPLATSGDFIMVVDSKGGIIWLDIIRIARQSEYVPHPLFLDVSDEGIIYLCSVSSGDIRFGSGKKIQTKTIAANDAQRYTYLACYSKGGTLNWIKSNETISNAKAVKAAANGVYLSQFVYGSSIFNNHVDTTGHITEFLTFLDKKGNHRWSKSFPVDNIHSITIDSHGLPIISGSYNDRIYRRYAKNLSFDGFTLSDKHDFFVFGLDRLGTATFVKTADLSLRTDYNAHVPRMKLGPDNSIYIIAHSEYISLENYVPGAKTQNPDIVDMSFLGKLMR